MLSPIIFLTLSSLFMATARLTASAMSKARPSVSAKLRYAARVIANKEKRERDNFLHEKIYKSKIVILLSKN